MTDETSAPEPEADSPAQQAYNDAYNAVVAQHEMTTATNGTITCSCGDTGMVAIDMSGHWGEEARRAGDDARASVQ